MTPTRLAVVIPAHNERARLPACLRSLRAATGPVSVPVELVVVADACADDTAAIASAAGATVVTVADRNVGRARAAGMEHALRHGPDGLWLATTDADSRVPRSWLAWHLAHGRAGADLLAGTVAVDDWSAWPPGLPAATSCATARSRSTPTARTWGSRVAPTASPAAFPRYATARTSRCSPAYGKAEAASWPTRRARS